MESWLHPLLTLGRRWRASWRPAWAMMPEANATLLVDTLLEVLSILERQGVQYTVHYGCLLGAARLEGALPWDIDGDVFLVDENAESAARKLRSALEAQGYAMRFSPEQYYFTVCPALAITIPWLGEVRIPMFPLVEMGMLTPTVDESGRTWHDRHSPHRVFAPGELLPLRRYRWHEAYVMGPRDPEPVLERLYQEAASARVFEAFERPRISREAERFWRRARPAEGEVDGEAIARRSRERRRTLWWRCLRALPWYLANGAYCVVAEWVRRRLGGHTM